MRKPKTPAVDHPSLATLVAYVETGVFDGCHREATAQLGDGPAYPVGLLLDLATQATT